MIDPSAQRLLPADENFLGDLFSLEEPLLMWLEQTTLDSRAGDQDAWHLPAGLDGEKARAAWGHIFTALPEGLRNEWHAMRTGEEPKGAVHVYGPDGYEHTPLYAVSVDQADLDVLAALLDDCRRAVAREEGYLDLCNLLTDAGEEYGSASYGRQPETAQQVTDRLARTLAVLQLERDGDVEQLLQVVAAAGAPGGRIDLTAAQADAAERFTDRVITATTAGKPAIERDLQRFVAFGETSRRREQ
ncbi:hypothetical protein ACH4NT_36670 [Streptomyces lydicus]|uniref:hypothetical protein n=1 Tax=Streptomyces lydicus TaxID=47763 RepID=UPI00379A4E7A